MVNYYIKKFEVEQKRMKVGLKSLGYLFTILFGVTSVLQYNDPDSFIWILIYGTAAIISFLFSKGKLGMKVALILGIICLAGFVYLYPLNFQGFDLDDGDMKTVELGREAFGLLIIALVFFFYAFVLRKRL